VRASVAIGFLGTPSLPEMVRLAQKAEACGFSSTWVAETRFRRDAISATAAILAVTDQMRVATGLINVYTRNPVVTAMTAASLAELSGGRFILGLGTGSEEVLAAEGVSYDRPFTRLRESVDVLQRLLSGDMVSYRGETIRVDGARLEMVPEKPIPLYLGVTGPRGLALAGAVADGVLFDVFMPAAYIERAVQAVHAAARKAGRSEAELGIAGIVMTVIRRSRHDAREAVRPIIAGYLTKFPTIAAQTGFSPDAISALQHATHAGGLEAGATHVTPDMVEALCVAGTAEDCRVGVQRLRAAGLALPILMTPDDPEILIDEFAGGKETEMNTRLAGGV
jgi:5,10-methylenetetrahydromethanopterin reductase